MRGPILVTGITGDVGGKAAELLAHQGAELRGGVTNVARAKGAWEQKAKLVRLDFRDPLTFAPALAGVGSVFLMHPPAASDPKLFLPFIQQAKDKGVKHIVFLSLLGIERNLLPPHYRIEKYIKNSGIPYTFLRPGFYMQNLNNMHRKDIKERSDLFIPAGKAPVSFIDTRDIGEAAALCLADPDAHAGKSYSLTGAEALTFQEAAALFSKVLGRPITYSNPSAGEFKREMLYRGIPKELVNFMVALFFTAKLGLAKKVTPELEDLLGRKPTSLEQYIRDYEDFWK